MNFNFCCFPAVIPLCILGIAGRGHAQSGVLQLPDVNASPGATRLLPVSVQDYTLVAALQFDLTGLEDHVQIGSPLPATVGAGAASRSLSPGVKRIVCYATGTDPLPASVIVDIPLTLTETAPEGGPVLRVSNLCFAAADGTRIAAGPAYGPLTQWQFSVFSPADLADASVIGDDRDPDGDHVPNLVEYAVRGNPKMPDSEKLPSFSNPVPGNGAELRFTYRLARNSDGVTAIPQASTDLLDWFDLTAVPTGVEDAVTVEMQVLTGADARQFLRLNVQRTP